MRTITSIIFALPLSLVACASTPGAQPNDMSAANHDAMASGEAQNAGAHAAQHDPSARVEEEKCSNTRAGTVCWTSLENPTEQHRRDAEMHRKAAADHRAASQALRDAEARACAGISEEDRDMSPFEHREDIESVKEMVGPAAPGRGGPPAAQGALITFRARPGMTEQWLQRVVDCHLARNAALGHSAPEMAYCPLVPKDVKATVSTTSTGFAVAVRGADPETVREVLQRAKGLAGTSSALPVVQVDDRTGALSP